MRYLVVTAAVLCRLGVDALIIGSRDDCPTGWLKNGEKCYLFQHTGLMSSAACKNYCASASSNGFPARRLCIQSQDEQDFVARSLNGPTWLGCTYVSDASTRWWKVRDGGFFDWNWAEGPRCNSNQNFSNQNFGAEHYPQYMPHAETVMMQPSFGGRWTYSQFAHEGKCACEMPSESVPVLRHCPDGYTMGPSNKCYKFFPTTASTFYKGCATTCASEFSRMFCVESPQEAQFIRYNIPIGGVDNAAWLGFSDAAQEGSWVWSEGCHSTYNRQTAPWGTSQPDNLLAFQHYGVARWGSGWDDVGEADHLYVCGCERPAERFLPVQGAPSTTPAIPDVPVHPHCADGYILGPTNTKCYKFFPSTMRTTYHTCESTCAAESSSIPNLESDLEAQFFRDNVPWVDHNFAVWVKYPDSFVKNRPDAANFLGRYHGGWDYFELNSHHGCSCERPAINEPKQPVLQPVLQPAHPHCADGFVMGPTNKKCYKFTPGRVRYQDCKATCASESSLMVTWETKSESDYLKGIFGRIWLRNPPIVPPDTEVGATFIGYEHSAWMNFDLNPLADCGCERPSELVSTESERAPVQDAPSTPPAIPVVSVQPAHPHCADGYIMGPTKKKCYKFFTSTMRTTYHTCESTCASESSSIPNLESDSEVQFFRHKVPYVDSNSAVWVRYPDSFVKNRPGGANIVGRDNGGWDIFFQLNSHHGCSCERPAVNEPKEPVLPPVQPVQDAPSTTPAIPVVSVQPAQPHCADGYIMGPTNKKCYKFFPSTMRTTYHNCASTCASESSSIPNLESSLEAQFFRDNVPYVDSNFAVWVRYPNNFVNNEPGGANILGRYDGGWDNFMLHSHHGCSCERPAVNEPKEPVLPPVLSPVQAAPSTPPAIPVGSQRHRDPVSDLCPAGTIRKDNQCVEKETQRAEPVGGDAVPYYWDGYNKHFIRNAAEKEFVLSIISADAGKSFTDNSAPDEPTADWAAGQAASCDPSLTSDSPQAERRRRRALRIQQLQERLHVLQRRARADPSPPPPCNSTSSFSALPQEQQLPCRDWRPFPRPFGTVVKYLRDYEEYKEYVRESCLV